MAVLGTEPEHVYPYTQFLPGSGIHRGSTFIGNGDPLSQGWASVDNAYREDPSEVYGMPKIPSQPIGYDDAKILIEKLGGADPPSDQWKGGLNIDYKIGGEFKQPWSNWRAKLSTHNYEETIKNSNVIGIIKGSVEPDRYVLLSNHRDAWGYGAMDPSSATAQLMEVSRVFAKMKKSGWRPRRTLVFASWAAEEAGWMGSTEWVYEHLTKLQQRTVGLVNTDTCVSGPIAKLQSSPVMRDIVMNSLKYIRDFTTDFGRSYYDFLKEWTNQDNDGPEKEIEIRHLLGSSTDHAAFAFYAGIPAFFIRFRVDHKKYKGITQYATYHTGFENFYLVDNIVDPGYKIHRACAQTSMYALMKMADSPLVPFNARLLPKSMQETLDTFERTNVTKTLKENGASLQYVKKAVMEFMTVCDEFMDMVERDDSLQKDPLRLRMVNDQLMHLDRTLLIDGGIPGRPSIRNAVFAPGKYNMYGGGGFPGIPDLLYDIDRLESEERKTRWKTIKKHVSDLMILIQAATKFLKPLDEI